jgi:hypothetical protein
MAGGSMVFTPLADFLALLAAGAGGVLEHGGRWSWEGSTETTRPCGYESEMDKHFRKFYPKSGNGWAHPF